MLEGHYRQRDPRVHVATTSASLSRRRLLFLRTPQEDADALLDLSKSGMKILASSKKPKVGDTLEVELKHPSLSEPLTLEAEVQWVRLEANKPGTWGAGLRFADASAENTAALERVLSFEVGSSVRCTGMGHVGYVAPGSDAELAGRYFIYDAERAQVALIDEEPLFYRVMRTRMEEDQTRHRDFETFQQSLRWIFGLEETKLDIDPPLDPAPKRP